MMMDIPELCRKFVDTVENVQDKTSLSRVMDGIVAQDVSHKERVKSKKRHNRQALLNGRRKKRRVV
jgi:hypothetical protein